MSLLVGGSVTAVACAEGIIRTSDRTAALLPMVLFDPEFPAPQSGV